jgi:hypothetical protein
MKVSNTHPRKEVPLVPGCEFTSCPVQAVTGEAVGVVQDLLVDAASGRIAFVVVRRSGRTRIDHKLVAVPWLKMHWEPRRDCLVLEASPDELRKLPQFDRPPEPDAPGWREIVRLHREAPAPGDF